MPWRMSQEELDLNGEEYEDEAIGAMLEDYDDEAWVRDDESLGEAKGVRYRRGRATRLRDRRVAGLRGGTVRTRAGDAKIQFEKPLATKESVDALAQELRGAIKRIDQTLDKNTSVLDKKIAAAEANLKKGQQLSQQSLFLPLLLSRPPQIDKVKIGQLPPGTTFSSGVDVPIDTTTYKKEDNNLFLLLALMGGGLGGSSADNNMGILALALLLK